MVTQNTLRPCEGNPVLTFKFSTVQFLTSLDLNKCSNYRFHVRTQYDLPSIIRTMVVSQGLFPSIDFCVKTSRCVKRDCFTIFPLKVQDRTYDFKYYFQFPINSPPPWFFDFVLFSNATFELKKKKKNYNCFQIHFEYIIFEPGRGRIDQTTVCPRSLIHFINWLYYETGQDFLDLLYV